MYPDLSYSEATGAATTETLVLGVAPQKMCASIYIILSFNNEKKESKITVYFSDTLGDPSRRWVRRMGASAVLIASAIHATASEGQSRNLKQRW